MNNHYHLYLKTPEPNISKIMKFLNQSYARYYLKKYPDKDGHVFKGRYKRKIVQSNLYSLQLTRYIHLNPVKAKLVEDPLQWKWSSYSNYIKDKKSFNFLDKDWLLGQFSSSDKERAIRDFANYTYHEEGRSWDPDKHTHAKIVLGSKEYFREIITKHLDVNNLDEDTLCYQELKLAMQYDKQTIIDFINSLKLQKKNKSQYLAYLLKTHTTLSLKEIGTIINKKAKTVSAANIYVKNKIAANKDLRKLLEIKC
jgi:hypothetical protein